MKPAWIVTHSRWHNPPDDEDAVIGIASRREVFDGDTYWQFRLSDDDRVIYYHGEVAVGTEWEDIVLEELYRWGGYYAGTVILYLYNPDTWEWEHTIS